MLVGTLLQWRVFVIASNLTVSWLRLCCSLVCMRRSSGSDSCCCSITLGDTVCSATFIYCSVVGCSSSGVTLHHVTRFALHSLPEYLTEIVRKLDLILCSHYKHCSVTQIWNSLRTTIFRWGSSWDPFRQFISMAVYQVFLSFVRHHWYV